MSYYSLCGELRLLIHRVELKPSPISFQQNPQWKLLIHRVELKLLNIDILGGIPGKALLIHRVELKRGSPGFQAEAPEQLLIHRVELKPWFLPCLVFSFFMLLIHRVELKPRLLLRTGALGARC